MPWSTLTRLHRRAGLLAILAVAVLAQLAQAGPQRVTGSLETVRGVRVLKLWGSSEQRGYAHGYLMGQGIAEFFEGVVLDPQVMKDPRAYETEVRGKFLRQMRFSPERRAELEGMLRGITDAVGVDGTRLKRLGRNLDVRDLMAINCLADWYRFMCSSFSAWGDATEGGEMITARNLDFMLLPGLDTSHLVIVHLEPGPGKQPWVSVAWPGLIGAYTAMNAEGVTISMHDAAGLDNTHQGAFVPRSIALRDALESARAATAVADVKRTLIKEPSITGNNIHVSSPFTGQRDPAAVFEYDGNLSKDGGVTQRVSRAKPLPVWLACTNHYCLRSAPPSDQSLDTAKRFAVITKVLTEASRTHRKIGLAFAREVMSAVGGLGTIHTVVFFPNSKRLYMCFAEPGVPAPRVAPVQFALAELLRR